MKKISLLWLSLKNLKRNKFFLFIKILIVIIFSVIFSELSILIKSIAQPQKIYPFFLFFSLLFFLCLLIISGQNIKLRFLEIGLLKSFGAKKSHIFWLLLSETMLLGTIGSIIGIVIWLSLFSQISTIIPVNIKNKIVLFLAALLSILSINILSFAAVFYYSLKSSFLKPYIILKQAK